MKRFLVCMLTMVSIGFFSCESSDDSLATVELQGADLNFSVTQNAQKDNDLTMTSSDKSVIPYWSYTDAEGNELGHSNKAQLSVTMPFAGEYYVNYTAYTNGGAVRADPVKVTISANDEEYFSDEEWQMLTNGVAGKTWVLNMVNPIGYGGLDFPYNPDGSDYWNWYPDYAGNEWLLAVKNWGEMTFDLDGGYNIAVTQTALNSAEQTTKTGSFTYNIEGHDLTLNGGTEILYGGDYHPDVSNWSNVQVVELSENSLRLAVIRDQSRTNEGNAKIIFHYKPKE